MIDMTFMWEGDFCLGSSSLRVLLVVIGVAFYNYSAALPKSESCFDS